MKYKYTKFVSVFLVCIICITSVGCVSEKIHEYESIVVTAANDGIEIEAESDFWTGVYFEKTNMEGQSCTVENISYSGEYKQSIVDTLNSYTTDIYCDENYVEFGLRSDTKQLVFINLMNKHFFDNEPYLDEIENPQNNAILLAREIAEKYVSDIDAYTRIVEEPVTRYKEKDGQTYEISYYVVTFAKKIQDYYTSDYISIKITSKGNLATIMMGDIGAFDDLSVDVDQKTLNQSIDAKVTKVYQETGYELISFELEDQKIVLDPNGNICMYSMLAVHLDANETRTFKTGIVILTAIDETP